MSVQTFAGAAKLPRGAAQHSYGPGWWLYWNRLKAESYVVRSVLGGQTQVETFAGHVVPRCCAGGQVVWR